MAYQMLKLSVKSGSHFLGTTTNRYNTYRGHFSLKKRFKISGAFETEWGEKVLRGLDFWSVIP
ncbi:hypothetical protein PVAP13_5KG425714 [Panicum virgatum]|uniref:Uncharacterized protein n=1 Tax=Panicum virgatum TaxID=38727 RepID=A0A8T0SN60_PANVG|nr:hypothetical protein PVAP13_5KG425714 [Panicum virgatum]